MKMMKKMLAFLLMLCLVLSLAACGSDEPEDTQPESTSGQSASNETSLPVDDSMVTYTIKVVDTEGNPIPGAMVQLCKDSCTPGIANDEGVATIKVPQDDYKVSMLSMPEGYTHSTGETEFYFEAGSQEITIVLKAV